MSTEEQNRPTATAGIPLQGKALEAALAAAAGIPARPVEDIPTDYEPVVAAGVTSPPGFAEAARNLIDDRSFEWAKPPALTLVRDRDDVEMEALEARRQTAISALRNAIAKAEGEERDDLEQALERLESAKNPSEIQAALTVAQSTLSREAAGGGSKAAGGNDPQERLDRAWEKIGELNKKSDTNFQKLDRYLTDEEKAERKKRDEEVEKRKAELERLKNSGASAEEILRAQQALHAAEKRRTEYDQQINDRIRNDPNTSPEDKETADTNAKLLAQKLKELEEAQKAALEVYEEKLKKDKKNQQLTAEEREQLLREKEEEMKRQREDLLRQGQIQSVIAITEQYTESKGDLNTNKSRKDQDIAASEDKTTKPEPKPIKLEYAQADHSNKTPATSPDRSGKDSGVVDLS